MRRSTTILLCVCVWLSVSLVATEALGQTVDGHVLEESSRDAIEHATIALLDAEGTTVATVVSDLDGHFLISADAGAYRLRITHLAFEEITSNGFHLADDQTLIVSVLMDPAPRTFDEITVTDTRAPRAAEIGGHYGRRSLGIGRFISRDDIDARSPRYITDMLQGIPGIRLRDGDFRLARASVPSSCAPTVVLDNVVIRRRGQAMGMRLDDIIRPQDVEAIEVYTRGTGLPAQYGGRESPCGAILLWSRAIVGR